MAKKEPSAAKNGDAAAPKSALRIQKILGTLKRDDVEWWWRLPDLLKLIEGIVADIPAEIRDHVLVDWMDGDDGDSGFIEFKYYREETDEEMDARIWQERAQTEVYNRQREAQERRLLEALKAKYEQKP